MIQAISSHPSDRRQSAQTAATGFQGKATASASEPETEEQPATSTIVEAGGCKMLVIKKGKCVTMKINLGDVNVESPADRNQTSDAQTSGKAASGAPSAVTPQENQYLQNDANAAGLAGGLLFTARA